MILDMTGNAEGKDIVPNPLFPIFDISNVNCFQKQMNQDSS